MSVLVTGGTGFLGLNIAEQLLARGEAVVLLGANPPPPALLEALRRLPGRLRVVLGEVCDGAALAQVMATERVERVMHAAAVTAGAEREAREPRRIAEVNHLGTIHALEAARAQGVRRFLYVGTGSVYGAAGVVADDFLDEDEHLPVPASLYGITKYAAERTCLRLKALWGLDLAVARLAMVFGRWEYDTGLRDRLSLPLQAMRIARAGGEAVLPEGEFRDWIYAPDAASGLVALLDAPGLAHDLYHLGTGAPWPMTAWCERLRARYPDFSYRVSSDPRELTVTPLAPGGRTPFAARRIREDTGFRPAFGLDEAVADYLAWLDRHPL